MHSQLNVLFDDAILQVGSCFCGRAWLLMWSCFVARAPPVSLTCGTYVLVATHDSPLFVLFVPPLVVPWTYSCIMNLKCGVWSCYTLWRQSERYCRVQALVRLMRTQSREDIVGCAAARVCDNTAVLLPGTSNMFLGRFVNQRARWSCLADFVVASSYFGVMNDSL